MSTRLSFSTAFCLTLGAVSLVAASAAQGAPAVGDAYVYQLVNTYSKEITGNVRYEVRQAAADRIVFEVIPDKAAAGAQRTEIHTRDGNWLRGQLDSHGVPVDYEFAAAYPAYAFPLEPGKRWSTRVNATAAGSARSVRVDGRVLGPERVRVPAGEYDTIKVQRFVYPGDGDFRDTETQIVELDWYAPALGRSVRTERRSKWFYLSCHADSSCDYNGEWSVLELLSAPR